MPDFDSTPELHRKPLRGLTILTVVTPLAIIAALVLSYVISPSFYLTYVLEAEMREYQAVEIATFTLLLLAGLVLVGVVWRLWGLRARWKQPGDVLYRGWYGLGLVFIVMLACFFVAGEEIDWGDSYGWWGENPPKGDREMLNLHNTSPLPIKSMGSLFLVVVFFVLPLAWALRDRVKLPTGLGIVIAEWPVVVAMAVAFTWRLSKNIYVSSVGKDNLGVHGDGGLYWDFVEQLNEHKELLVAVALFFYAVWMIRRTAELVAAKDSASPSGAASPEQR